MKLSDFEIKEWILSDIEDTQAYLTKRRYKIDKRYGCSVGFGLSLIVWKNEEHFDRIYELIVFENGSLIEFYSTADEWEFLLEYLPKIKQYWDGCT